MVSYIIKQIENIDLNDIQTLFISSGTCWRASELEEYISKVGVSFVGAFNNSKNLIGFCMVDNGELRYFSVANNYRHLRVGKSLLTFSFKIGLHYLVCFKEMVGYYIKFGFKVTRVQRLTSDKENTYKEMYENKLLYSLVKL